MSENKLTPKELLLDKSFSAYGEEENVVSISDALEYGQQEEAIGYERGKKGGKYTEEDMRRAINFGWDLDSMKPGEIELKYKCEINGHYSDCCDNFIKALDKKEANEWISVEEQLPDLERTVWLCNDKEQFVWLGELIDTGEGLFFGVLNSRNSIYGDNGKIVTECEPEDVDVTHWQYTHMLPAPPQQVTK